MGFVFISPNKKPKKKHRNRGSIFLHFQFQNFPEQAAMLQKPKVFFFPELESDEA